MARNNWHDGRECRALGENRAPFWLVERRRIMAPGAWHHCLALLRRAKSKPFSLLAECAPFRPAPVPRRLEDLRQHVLIGYDRDPAYAQLLEQKGVRSAHELFAFRSDSELAQLAALRAGFGLGVSQLGIARRDKNLVPMLHSEFIYPMDAWLVMRRDLRGSRRIRLLFDQLSTRLSAYAQSSCFARQD